MIHHLEGILEEKPVGKLVLDVDGVGYEIVVAESTWREAGIPGSRVRVLTHLVVREDQWLLFGFRREEERALFRLLLEVQGVGPKVAIAVMSGLPVDRLRRVIGEGDVGVLTTLPGVGKKTASRIVVEMKDKLAVFADANEAATTADGEGDDAVDALVALGYPRHVAREAVRGARGARVESSPEELLREALRRL